MYVCMYVGPKKKKNVDMRSLRLYLCDIHIPQTKDTKTKNNAVFSFSFFSKMKKYWLLFNIKMFYRIIDGECNTGKQK